MRTTFNTVRTFVEGCCRLLPNGVSDEETQCLNVFLVPVPEDCVNYYLTNIGVGSADFTWDEYPNATGYNVYSAPQNDPANFTLEQSNIPLSVLATADNKLYIVTAITAGGESPQCDPIQNLIGDLIVDTESLPLGWRFFEYGTGLDVNGSILEGIYSYPPPAVPPVFDSQRTLSASGGVAPYTWSIESGILPEGLTLDASTGLIHGIPLPLNPPEYQLGVRGSIASKYPIVFKVEDSVANVAYAAFTMLIQWAVRIQGSLNYPEEYVRPPGWPPEWNLNDPVDLTLVVYSSTDALFTSTNRAAFVCDLGIGRTEQFNVTNVSDLNNWAAAASIPGYGYSDSDAPRPIANLLGVYNVSTVGGATGTFTFS